ncbi:MAG: type VI secretion system baseplate subunit TssG [Candidatus Eisenbacteria bacterium]|nr:type VI secretion system baseplate subunit TssG [Candidatus Eisenbacteria bacterium]MCC7143852.1 type VI secretion system baseplate subunit TssG [Candidatus Eisenbacteria bacterium]
MTPSPFEAPHAYSFFQIVGFLIRQREGTIAPGGEGPARRETIRFRPSIGLGFPTSDVQSVERYELPGEEIPVRFRVTVNFMGLYGPSSPLPNHYSEDLIWYGEEGQTQRDFLDLFHHRMISFVYRAWAKYRHWASYRQGGSDTLTRMYLGLIGLGTPGLREAAPLPPLSMLRAAGLLGGGSRSAAGLAGLLRDQWGDLPITVESFLSRVVSLPRSATSSLGKRGVVLGRDLILGERVVDRRTAFSIHLGPVGAEEFARWLPGGERFEAMVKLVRFYVTDPLDFALFLTLKREEVPALRLGARQPLGQMSWLLPDGTEDGVVRLPADRWDPLRNAA